MGLFYIGQWIRDARAAERFLSKALGGENRPAPRVINTDKNAAYPLAIVQLKSEAALEENCCHRPVQYLEQCSGAGSSADQASGPRESAFPLLLGSLAYNRWLRGHSYDSQRPSVGKCGGCEGRYASSLHSWFVCCELAKLPIICSALCPAYKVATHPFAVGTAGVARCGMGSDGTGA